MKVPNPAGLSTGASTRHYGAARTAGNALRQWWRAAMLESLCVGLL